MPGSVTEASLLAKYYPGRLRSIAARRFPGATNMGGLHGLHVEDLAQAGAEGMVIAARRFVASACPDECETYAVRFAVGAMHHEVRRADYLSEKHRASADEAELEMLRPVQLDEGSAHPADTAPTAEEQLAEAQQEACRRAAWIMARSRMQARDLKILAMVFERGMSQVEVGHSIGLTSQRVGQLLRRTLKQLGDAFGVRIPPPHELLGWPTRPDGVAKYWGPYADSDGWKVMFKDAGGDHGSKWFKRQDAALAWKAAQACELPDGGRR